MTLLTFRSLTLGWLLIVDSAAAFQNPHVGRKVRGAVAGETSSTTALAAAAKKKAARKKGTQKNKIVEAVDDTGDAIDVAQVINIADVPNVVVTKPPPLPDKPEGWKGPQVTVPDILNFDLTGGRPGAIIESEEELERKEKIFQEIEDGTRGYPEWLEEYGFLEEELDAEYDNDDPDAIDASTLGNYDITDLQAKFDNEWDPETDEDPNIIKDTTGFIQENEKDEEGIEVGYDPLFGPSNPIDTRTKTGVVDSYMIDDRTRDDRMLTPEFLENDPEIKENEDFKAYRKSLDIIETYVDEFLPDMNIPRHVAIWHGFPEPTKFEAKPYTNNRFTDPKDLTDFDSMDPYRARQRAIELARAKNSEWLPDGVSQAWHQEQRRPYDEVGTLVGTLKKGEVDPAVVESIQPALKVLGSCVDLLSVEGETVFRFHYHGLMKNKYGMACWAETLIRDCGVEVTGVVFETGFRSRDRQYDGGDPYYGFS